ncbi:hypothetical protein [Archangium sp.]|uniref:hypothetical protein n=1 Tax=Archangium sp. TaxID=1872627 RepID=UPI002D30EC60|nr:hypothetical protein [Archangium sp.]HYO54513.1 hypothetical protein [Archangium sp.]
MSDLLKGLGSALSSVTNLLSGGALIDAAGNALGLPPVITNAAKALVGAITGNVLLVASGAMGLAQELTRNPPATTEYRAPKDGTLACEGYAKKPGHGASAVGTSGSSMKGIINDPHMSLEEKIEAILMNLTQKMDDEILQTMDDLTAAQDKQARIKNGKGDEKALTDAQRDIDRISMRLQKLVEKRKMMFEMMSTLSMKFNEMAKTALSNMRSA